MSFFLNETFWKISDWNEKKNMLVMLIPVHHCRSNCPSRTHSFPHMLSLFLVNSPFSR